MKPPLALTLIMKTLMGSTLKCRFFVKCRPNALEQYQRPHVRLHHLEARFVDLVEGYLKQHNRVEFVNFTVLTGD